MCELVVLMANNINPYLINVICHQNDLIMVLLFNRRDLDFLMVGSAYISMDQSKNKNVLAASGEGSRGVALYCLILSYVTAFH